MVAGLSISTAFAVTALYPRLGDWVLRNRVLPRIGARLGRAVSVRSVAVYRGRAVLEDLVVRGPNDTGSQSLARVDRIEVEFDLWSVVRGEIKLQAVYLEGAHINVVRRAEGTDNYRDLAHKLGIIRDIQTPTRAHGENTGSRSPLLRRLRPSAVSVTDASLRFRDEAAGFAVEAEDIDAMIKPGRPLGVVVSGISLTTGFGPAARAAHVHVTADLTNPMATAAIDIRGGEVIAHRAIRLSGIAGRIESDGDQGKLAIELKGSYGGAIEPLWGAKGWIDPFAGSGSVHLEADRFSLRRLDAMLRDSPIIDYDNTGIDAEMDIDLTEGRIAFIGTFELTNFNVSHLLLAAEPIVDIDVAGSVSGDIDLASRTLTIDEADLRSHGVDYRLDGFVRMPGGVDSESGERRSHTHLAAHVVIPPLACQKMLEGIPTPLMPYLRDYKLEGEFSTDVELEIDFADLESARLDGAVAIFECEVVEEPDNNSGIQRLVESFNHYVEVEREQWIEFWIGPENPDFVPIWDVSEHLLNSFMTTEDSRFYEHQGFITREFRTALIKNLQAGYFRYGASSITMQTVKNVLLHREKTLARKLQELFLTWHLETLLDKQRIFEIYVNAIEYGPWLYGIGSAARHYFGKHPRDLNPVEAAFLSSILPAPKRRYKQYCDDRVSRWTEKKIARILKLMHERERLSDEEYELARLTPLVFDRTEALPVAECRRLVKRTIENAPSTDPAAEAEAEAAAQSGKKSRSRSHRCRRRATAPPRKSPRNQDILDCPPSRRDVWR